MNVTLALSVMVYSIGRWDRMGVHYHSLLQFLLMGLNGAFLTGDLFNLFVFFEILLAASYALLLHGGGPQRDQDGAAFHRGESHGLVRLPDRRRDDLQRRRHAQHGGDRLEVARDVAGRAQHRAGRRGDSRHRVPGQGRGWPLNFWLPGAYHAAGAPVAAIFAITTKVGVYAMLRAGSLLEDPSAPFGGAWLFYLAIATMLFGIVGMLASRQLPRLVAFVVILSSGTILAAVGSGTRRR